MFDYCGGYRWLPELYWTKHDKENMWIKYTKVDKWIDYVKKYKYEALKGCHIQCFIFFNNFLSGTVSWLSCGYFYFNAEWLSPIRLWDRKIFRDVNKQSPFCGDFFFPGSVFSSMLRCIFVSLFCLLVCYTLAECSCWKCLLTAKLSSRHLVYTWEMFLFEYDRMKNYLYYSYPQARTSACTHKHAGR